MKTILLALVAGIMMNHADAQVIKCYHKIPTAVDHNDRILDSAARISAKIINNARRANGIDTLEFEADTFGFATDWADSTNRYFHVDGNPFSRAAAHRNCADRVVEYEDIRGREWKHFAECLGTGTFSTRDDIVATEVLSRGLLGSKDHYDVLMKHGYKKIIIGISRSGDAFTVVVFVTTEHK